MTFTERISELVTACFTAIWVVSQEHEDALSTIGQLCYRKEWRLATWDIERGVVVPAQKNGGGADLPGADPLAAIRSLPALAPQGESESSSLLVLMNLHRFLGSAEIVQALTRQIIAGKQDRTFVVVLAPAVNIPIELEKLFVVVEHELPGRDELADIARGVTMETGGMPQGSDLETVLDAAAGLSRYEAEAAFALAIVREGLITAPTLWEQKSQMLKKGSMLQLHRGTEKFTDLGGLAAMKAFTKRALMQPSRGNPLKQPRGILLLSPPGCGKTAFCKALGNETNRPVVVLDVGALMGSLLGQTEERTRRALQIADAMAPCVLMIDEVEKAFAGMGSSGQSDGGVSARMFGTFLSWLNDHQTDVFTVCTANDVSKLPPEFARAERFDGVFFLDLPTAADRREIWDRYISLFELDDRQPKPQDTDWTGAEIRSCCRLAALLDLPLAQAALNIVPVAVTAAESIDKLRSWASGRCLSADRPGIYRREAAGTQRTSRRVSRDPSQN